jgi:hypothetical protein
LHACRRWLDALPDSGGTDEGDLLHGIAAGIAGRLDSVAPRSERFVAGTQGVERLVPSWQHLAEALANHAPADATIAQRLMETELVVSIVECWTRAADFDRMLAARSP